MSARNDALGLASLQNGKYMTRAVAVSACLAAAPDAAHELLRQNRDIKHLGRIQTVVAVVAMLRGILGKIAQQHLSAAARRFGIGKHRVELGALPHFVDVAS